ncbi:MAG: putative RND superfamily exporter protein, partial [Roseivirga sp.]
MWSKIPHIVLKYRLPLMIFLLIFTVFMGYMARDVKLAFNFNTAVPETDENYKYFLEFKKNFGEDGNILVLGVKDSSLYDLEKFNKFYTLNKKLESIEGITNVISLATLKIITKDKEDQSFALQPLIPESPKS